MVRSLSCQETSSRRIFDVEIILCPELEHGEWYLIGQTPDDGMCVNGEILGKIDEYDPISRG